MRWIEMKSYKFLSRSLYFHKIKILVIGDLHFGYEEELNNAGIAVPRRMVGEIIDDLKKIIVKTNKVEKIIILGDIRHSFGTITKQERQDINKFLDFLEEKFSKKKVILIRGNHDTMIDIVFRNENWKNVEIVDYYVENGILFFHGDYKSFKKVDKEIKKAKLLVVGHFHPAIDLTDGEKVERFKCFVVGNFKRKEIVVLPSFFPLVEGTNILGDCELDLLDLKKRKVFVVSPDGEVLDFGKFN